VAIPGPDAVEEVVRVYILGSGSSGNCLVVEAVGERLLIDAGMSPTRAVERMRALGADFVATRPPLGVLVTHDHGDHSAHALPISRALRAPIITHEGVAIERARRRSDVRSYVPGRTLALGPFLVEALPIPHDAPQVALRVRAGALSFAVATDLGEATRELRAFLRDCDLVFLESNYCPRLLESGPYPLRLQRRVGGRLGHLGNDQAANLAASLMDTRVSRLVLVHLSRTNNTPDRAHDVVAARAGRLPISVLPHAGSRAFDVARGSGMHAAQQLGFGFI
jgi:phosphoribosyl 1,2-cyclic phosphodiesterase